MRKIIWAALTVSLLSTAGLFLTKQDKLADEAYQYYWQTQVDPLFAWPGIDLNNMDIAIDTLQRSRDEIIELTGKQYNRDITDRVQKVLYPTEYLKKMSRLETLRRDLSGDKTVRDLEDYQTQLITTIKSYQDYLDLLIPALEKTAVEQDYKGLEYHFGQTSFDRFLAVLQQYRKDVDNTLQNAMHRWECATNADVICAAPVWKIHTPVPRGSIDPERFESTNAKIVSSIRLNSQLKSTTMSPNWAVTTSHKCFEKHSEVYYFLSEFDLGEPVPIWKADAINDVLVHDHRVTAQTTDEYEKLLKKFGAEGYLYQPYTTQYACPDLAADTGLLRSMSYVYDRLQEFEWVQIKDTEFDQHSLYLKLQNDAQEITDMSYLSEPHIQDFIRDLSILLNTHDDEYFSKFWGRDQQQNLEEMVLTYNNRSSRLAEDIMALVYANTAIGDYVNYASWHFVDELLFVRNAPALLLGGFNPSINPNGYRHVEHYRVETSPRLQSYNETLSQNFTPEKFAEILLQGTNAEDELSKLQSRSYFIRD